MRKLKQKFQPKPFEGCNLPYSMAVRHYNLPSDYFARLSEIQYLVFHFVKQDKQLFFYSDFYKNMLLQSALSENEEIVIGHYSTMTNVDENEIELSSWFALFDFIERNKSNFNHAAAFFEIKDNIPVAISEQLTGKASLSQHAYCKQVQLSIASLERQLAVYRKQNRVSEFEHQTISLDDLKG